MPPHDPTLTPSTDGPAPEPEDDLDVVVVGGGPAGLSAALVLGRARRTVLLVDAGEPRNARSSSLHGFLTRDGAAPGEVLEAGRREVRSYGVELIEDEVTEVRRDGDSLRVRTKGGRAARARRVIVATGLADELPAIAGVAERWGRDVLHCPYCHGYEVRDRPLATIAEDPDGASTRRCSCASGARTSRSSSTPSPRRRSTPTSGRCSRRAASPSCTAR